MTVKSEIIEKCARLFKTYGIKSNTMDDIAAELGVSKKTLYHHINDKQELIERCVNHELTRMKTSLDRLQATSENPIEHFIRLNLFVLNYLKNINPSTEYDLKKHYPAIYDKTKNQFKALILDAIHINIEQGLKQNLYLPEINPEVITQIHSERLDQAHYSQKLWEQNQSSPGIIKEMINYYIRGLVNENGLQTLNNQINKFEEYLKE